MRTTITLAPDVAAAVEDLRRERSVGVSEIVNEMLRRALVVPDEVVPFRQCASEMGAPRLPLDDIGGLLDALEGDDRRA